MSSFFADENSIVQLSPNLEIEINPDPCFKLLAGTTLFSPILSPSPERQSVIRNRPSPGNNTRNDNIEETNYSESSIEGLVSGTESSPLTTIERSVERKRRENEESEQLAWDMMREESLSAYRMQMDFIASSANEMSAEDLEAIQMAMGGANSYTGVEQEQEDIEDDEEEEQDENQDSDVDQWDYDRLLALGEVIGDVKTERWRLKSKRVIAGLQRITFAELKMQPVNHPAINSCCATAASESSLKGCDSVIKNTDASERSSPKMKKVRDDPSCAVCMEVFTGEDLLYVLPCQHYFHESCTQGWLADHSSCPMCKSSVCITPEK